MRKMMIAVVLTAACGSVGGSHGDNTGSGSDTGSDMGSGSDGPSTCNTAADCSTGMACDIGQHMCVTATFTIDKTGFVDDGTRWWTSKSDPTLHGTIDNPSGETLTVSINNMTIGTATITGTTWSIDLPAGSITEADTSVVLALSSGVEQRQLFALDDKAPVAVMFGSIKDERGDTIDFSTGEAVHTHAGAAVSLDGTGCPAVYKYDYLMDATKPQYGSETTPNPFTWQIKASDATPIDNMDSAYRVRDAAGRVLYNWTSMQPDASGVFAITLHRNDIKDLGTQTEHMFLDVRFRDAFGNESTTTACWDNHPMAPPLEIKPMQKADVFGWTLAADSPISTLSIYTPGATVYSQHIVQYAADPILVHYGVTPGAVTYSRTAVDHYVVTATGDGSVCATAGACQAQPTDGADDVVTNGTIPGNAAYWYATVTDEVTGQTILSQRSANNVVFGLPGRTSGSAHSYRIDIKLGVLNWYLAPPRDGVHGSIGEFTLNNLTYTGWSPWNTFTACTHTLCKQTPQGVICGCNASATYAEMRALESMSVAFPAFGEQLTTASNATVSPEAPAYAAAALAVPAMGWNAGTDNLPQ